MLAQGPAGGWCALTVLFLWVDGLLGHAVCVRHHNYHALVCGGGWCVADTNVFWGALVHCWVSGMAHGCCSWPDHMWLLFVGGLVWCGCVV